MAYHDTLTVPIVGTTRFNHSPSTGTRSGESPACETSNGNVSSLRITVSCVLPWHVSLDALEASIENQRLCLAPLTFAVVGRMRLGKKNG